MKKIYIILLILFFGCETRFSPKPKGYLRIELEPKIQALMEPKECPFSFNLPDYFALNYKSQKNCWIDLTYPKHKATIHITYKKINNNLFQLLEESRQMAYKHTVKADAINEQLYSNKINSTYGKLYNIQGETASSVQFHLTDSANHFIRGSLYFSVQPNQDSLRPIVNYLREDIILMMESLQWNDGVSSLQ